MQEQSAKMKSRSRGGGLRKGEYEEETKKKRIKREEREEGPMQIKSLTETCLNLNLSSHID